MHIEAVTVCVDYSDFLEESIKENLRHLDRWVIVTSHQDHKTRALCAKYSIECVVTDIMHEKGQVFNKGAAINLGLGHLKGLDWILHLDADIILPGRFRDMLDRADLQRECLYGADRINIVGWDTWQAYKHNREPYFSSGYFVEAPKGFNVGARIIHKDFHFSVIGYYQLWHKSSYKKYPTNQGNAEHTDVLFSCQWARKHRVLLPEIYVLHLESERCEMGRNWDGRKTKWFGPCHHPHHPPKPKPYCK